MANQKELEARIERATSRAEIIEILNELKELLGERDPKVQELIKRYTR